MLAIIFIFLIIFIFPIFINGKFYFNKDEGKLFYKIKLFNFIKIFSGYVELLDEGILIHLTKRYAVLILYSNLLALRKKVEPLKDYHLVRVNFTINLGNDKSLIEPMFSGFLINYIINYLTWFLHYKKPYFKLKKKVNVFSDKNIFSVLFSGTVVLNLLMILLSFIKILVGKIYYAIAK